jgi:hypothetical protein
MQYLSGVEERRELRKKRGAANFALGFGIQLICMGLLLIIPCANVPHILFQPSAVLGIVIGALFLLMGLPVARAGFYGLRDLNKEEELRRGSEYEP